MQTVQTHSSPAAINQQPLIPFPFEGKVRVKQAAPFLGIGISTFWLYVNQGRINKPMRYGARVSVWNSSYIRELAEHGIPEKETT